MLEIGILDLCKRGPQQSASDALHGTLALAMEADRLGFHRYWVAEHHVEDSAEACPEVLIPLIAGCTKRIMVGSGRGATALLLAAEGGRDLPDHRSAFPGSDRTWRSQGTRGSPGPRSPRRW